MADEAEPKKLDWAKSAAKAMMAQDMMDGLVPVKEEIRDKEKLYNDFYAGRPEFEDWPYERDAFYRRIRSLQKTIKNMMLTKNIDEEAFLHDRRLHPTPGTTGGPTHYTNGTPLWQGSDAAEKLKDDFENGRHLNLTRAEFKASRACYQGFDESRITQRLDWHKQGTKEFGQTPGQSKAKKRPKQPQYKPENSRKSEVNAYVDGPAPPRKKRAKKTTKKA
ncbi:MAG: hypothetical protein SGARI_006020 [Bacillariaceae sp.]